MQGTYEFECKKCGANYEEFCTFDETGKYKGVKCPRCKSSKKIKLISGANFSFSNPVGTDRWTSEAGGHDYRYNWNKPNVAKQRDMAAAASHVGPTPYRNIDDISSGENFGEVK